METTSVHFGGCDRKSPDHYREQATLAVIFFLLFGPCVFSFLSGLYLFFSVLFRSLCLLFLSGLYLFVYLFIIFCGCFSFFDDCYVNILFGAVCYCLHCIQYMQDKTIVC